MAYSMAQRGTGAYRDDLKRARDLTERGASSFLDADIEAYMNPYIKGALEPAARELREEKARDIRNVGGKAGMVGAFGGSRQAILESEARRGGTEALSDLYGRGYAQAFESGAQMFDRDRAAASRGAEQFRALGAQGQQQLTQDIENLLATGGLKRRLEQAGLDFDYQQFLEARDWDITNLQPLLATLSSVPHNTESVGKQSSDSLTQVVGLGATIAGAVMTGGASMALGAAGSGLLGGGGGGDSGMQLAPAPSTGKPYTGLSSFGVPYVDNPSTVSSPQGATFFGSSYVPTFTGSPEPYNPTMVS